MGETTSVLQMGRWFPSCQCLIKVMQPLGVKAGDASQPPGCHSGAPPPSQPLPELPATPLLSLGLVIKSDPWSPFAGILGTTGFCAHSWEWPWLVKAQPQESLRVPGAGGGVCGGAVSREPEAQGMVRTSTLEKELLKGRPPGRWKG